MSRKLIISWQTYEWIKYCSGMILTDPNEYHVMVICKDNRRPILNHENLCNDAIYAQRRYDSLNISKLLGVSKLYNLGCEPDIINLSKLIAQLQINFMVGGISELFYNDYILLNKIFSAFPRKIPIYKYGIEYDVEPDKQFKLTIKEYNKKKALSDLMIGINNRKEKLYFSYTENFYRL